MTIINSIRTFIYKNIISRFDEILKSGSWRDAKSHLQEVSQHEDNQTPQYKVIEESGPDHDKMFTLGVYINGELFGTGSGPSKQIAQQQAAQAALDEYAKREKN